MTHRMTIRSNPKLLLVPLVAAVLVALAIAAFAVSPLLGAAGLALAAYIAWVLFRFVRKQLRCTVAVDDGGLRLDLYGEEELTVAWKEVSHMGVAREQGRRRVLFVYREDADKLLTVPDEFERFDELVAAAAAHGAMLDLDLEAGETLKERMRTIVGGAAAPVDAPEEPREEATPPPSE